jgi:hypothetical protein
MPALRQITDRKTGTTGIDRGPSQCYYLDVQRKEESIGWSTLAEDGPGGAEPSPSTAW